MSRLAPCRLVRRLLMYKGSLWRYAAHALQPHAGQGHSHRGWHTRWERPLEKFALSLWNDAWSEVAGGCSTAHWNGLSQTFAEWNA